MIKLGEAFEIAARESRLLRLADETLPLRDAAGRVAAEDVLSPIDLPPFDKSAMDGYAIPEGEFLDEYVVDAIVAAGISYDKPSPPGHCVKVMTGAPIPPGTARVIMWEDTQEYDGGVRIINKTGKSNICREGEDLKKGDVLCPKGAILTPLAMANIALAGVASAKVSKRPTAAVFSTGDELQPAGIPISPGKIYDSNGPMLSALLEDLGIPVALTGHLADNLDESVNGLKKGLADADVILLTGAVSKGDYDYLPQAFERVGLEIHFDEVAIKPGKPTTFATAGGKIVFGLPGNPVSSYLMFHLLVVPALYLMQGSDVYPRFIECPVSEEIKSKVSERDHFFPARLNDDGSISRVEYHGSGHLTALADADGFIEVESGVASIPAGGKVRFLPIMMNAFRGNIK